MKRLIFNELKEWKERAHRKPLLIRGARQVGKTYIVRQLGELFSDYIEINLEMQPEIKKVFDRDLDPVRILRDISLVIGKEITPGKTLLFFDEIQQEPKAISALRYFYEHIPDLHLIGAGSLLDFELEKIGLPVGRISSYYLYPLSFLEFLHAHREDLIIEQIMQQDIRIQLHESVHSKLIRLLGEYLAVGGMPEAVLCWIEKGDLKECGRIHRSIIDTYRQDFNKYTKKYQLKYVELLFNSIPSFLGKKFQFSHVPGEYRKRDLLPAFDLLSKAGIVYRIISSKGIGIPLWSEAHPDIFKVIFLDIALSQTILGIDASSWILNPQINFVNRGAISEAFVGQELLAYGLPDKKGELFYWLREARSSSAEVDYLYQKDETIIPIEVKSSAPGSLKSIHVFLHEHPHSPYGIRFSSQPFSLNKTIHSYPLYAVFKWVCTNKTVQWR